MKIRTFTLPIPPGINATYKIGHKTFIKSQAAKDWEEECGYLLIGEKIKKSLEGPLVVEIELYLKRDRDVDSVIKITLDLLERMGVYKNDMQVQKLIVAKHFDYGIEPKMSVKVQEVKS